MILKFKDIGNLAIKHYDHHMKKFGGKIHHLMIMELILICIASNPKQAKSIHRQLKWFIDDVEDRYKETKEW